MSNLDVSLRLKLERHGFGDGKRDVEDLRRATDRLGQSNGADALSRDLKAVERAATDATRDVQAVDRATDRLASNRGAERLGQGFSSISAKIDGVERAIREVGAAAEKLDREKLDRFQRELADTGRDADVLKRKLSEAASTRNGLAGAGRAAGLLATGAQGAFAALGAFASVDQIISGLGRLESKFRDVDRAAVAVAITAETRGATAARAIVDANLGLGRQIGGKQADIASARAVYAEGGVQSVSSQNTMLAPTLRAAIASNSSPEVMALAGRAYVGTMGGKDSELGAVFDMISKGAKLGSFNIPAMAKNLPQLGSQYAAANGGGLKGLSELIALAEVAAKGAGSEDEAANNLTNYLSKLFSPETIANFKKKRVNLPRVMKQGQARGQHPALTVLDEAMRVTGGDPVKMGELFGDQQVMNALRSLMANRQDLTNWQKEIYGNSAGTVEKDYNAVQGSVSGREDRLAADREASQVEIGRSLSPAAGKASRAYTAATTGAASIARTFSNDGFFPGMGELLKQTSPLYHMWNNSGSDADPEDIEAKRAEAAALARGIAAERAAIAKSGRTTHWGADSRIAGKQRRYDELVAGMKDDLSGAQTALAAEPAASFRTEELESRIGALTKALRDLEKKLDGQSTVSPISFNGAGGEARLWRASLGSSRVGGGRGGGGGFASAYSSGRPIMDGAANMPAGASAAIGGSGGAATRNPGGAKGEIYDVLSTSFSDPQSFALMGHMQQESQFDPAAWNTKEGAGGLLQWRGNRLENLKRFAADRGMQWQDRRVQAAFVSHEMQTDPYERKRSARFRAARTTEEASAALKDYVRFGDDSGGTRLGNARGIQSEFGAGGGFAAASGAVGRGSANHAHGQYGAPGENLVTVEAPGGAKFQVNKAAAASFQSFVNELEGSGYAIDPKTSGGFNNRRKRGGRSLSQHAFGNAIDINPTRNPMGKNLVTDMPAGVSDLAAKHGLSWGGDWRSTKDAMHFEWTGQAPQDAVASTGGALPQKAVPRPTPRPRGGNDDMPTSASLGKGRGGITIHQTINGSGDPRLAAARAQREQHRAIRLAESGAMHDTMVPNA